MELKVWVDGVQRVVCGVTEATTCQEVVIALAQAIGRSQLKHLKLTTGLKQKPLNGTFSVIILFNFPPLEGC